MTDRTSLSVSVRRHFVDSFFLTQAKLLNKQSKVVDIGGKKVKKRGLFNIEEFCKDVTYVNINKSDEPDVVADATHIPLESSSCDVVIMGELLEHVPDPQAVLKEAYRLLKDDGVALITVPFMYPVHADPFDYGRYTDYFWQEKVRQIGYHHAQIERQGGMFAVAALMVQHLFRAKGVSWRPIQTPIIKLFMWLDKHTTSPLFKAWSTGYGLVLTK